MHRYVLLYLSVFSIDAIAKFDKCLMFNRDILSNFAHVWIYLNKNIKIIINLKPNQPCLKILQAFPSWRKS